MKTLIYSDVHGNLPAFEKMLKTEADVEAFICLGDLVNYGPWSNECVDLAMSLPYAVNILGNHEEAFINGYYPGNNQLVKYFFNKSFETFSKFDEIKSFLLETKIDNFCCKHTIYNQFIYPDTTVILDNNYIIGHSHHQFKYKNNDFLLYNAGSIGQNRKYIDVINYLIHDATSGFIEMKSLVYNIDVVLKKIQSMCYSVEAMDYYRNKLRWT
jgi:hypothetical protein